MLAGVAVTLPRWPIVGRRLELEVFERAVDSGELAGVVIYGRAGVGKTRLADECRQQAAAAGHPTERVAGSRTTALLPLGAVVALLADGLGRPGPDGGVDTVALFEQARRALHERHHGRRVVTVADDVSLLDAASLALLGYLAAQGTMFLVATVRTGEPVPDLITSLWRDSRLERVDLEDLSRTHLDTLLHLALGGPIEAGAEREFWRSPGVIRCTRANWSWAALNPGRWSSGPGCGTWRTGCRTPTGCLIWSSSGSASCPPRPVGSSSCWPCASRWSSAILRPPPRSRCWSRWNGPGW